MELGLSGAEIGRYLGMSRQAVAYMTKEGERCIHDGNYILSF